ncbi:MAG: leucine-rich repeat protein [Clostridia bacterium]|nr:leucine-rich repeat protein [Clostridia bacterium]
MTIFENNCNSYKFKVIDDTNAVFSNDKSNFENEEKWLQNGHIYINYYDGNDIAISIPYEYSSNSLFLNTPLPISKICQFAFSNRPNLHSVQIPNSVTTIEYGAFSNCPDLKIINLPKSVLNISSKAFIDCDDLVIYCEFKKSEKPATWERSWNGKSQIVWNCNIFDGNELF